MLEGFEYMILVISWVITFCIVGAIIVITWVKVYEWIEYRDEEGYSIIWGRYGKVPEPTNEDILDLRKKFEFLDEVTKNLNQRIKLLQQMSSNHQGQIDEIVSKIIELDPSLRTKINKLTNNDIRQDNEANLPTN
jgi:hypothetical protein